MGIYTHLRHKLEPYENSPVAAGLAAWYAKVNEWKQEFLDNAENPEDVNSTKIAYEYAKRDQRKKELQAEISQLNIELEALSSLGVDAMETNNMQKIDLSTGGYVNIKDTPYSSVEDRSKIFRWIKKNKMLDLLTMNYQTLSGLNNDRLLAGEKLIPGTKIYMKTKLTVRGVGSENSENGDNQ